MKKPLVALTLSLSLWSVQMSLAQDLEYSRAMIDSLCAPRYHGRGYVNSGYSKATQFIKRQVHTLNPNAELSFQPFELSINTFPGAMDAVVNSEPLTPGKHFIIHPISGGANGEFEAVHFKPGWAKSAEKLFNQTTKGKFENKIVVLDDNTENSNCAQLISDIQKNPLKAAGYVILTDKKLTWSASRSEIDVPIILMNQSAVPKRIKRIRLNIDQEYKPNYEASNVILTVKGTESSNHKGRVYTAHLDHLGQMGKDTYIAGANDNASGSAMLLDIYKHYLENPPKFDITFIWFGGEEAGLIGSQYLASSNILDLENIGFLINLDLMGDASHGITAVNGKVFESHFAKLSSLNLEIGLLEKVKPRGPAANSDHHPFYEKGVPCFFIYTTGDYKHYHDINDVPANLPMTNYTKVFKLIIEFMEWGV